MEAVIRLSFKFPGLKEIRGKGLLLGLVCRKPAREVRDALLAKKILVGLSEDPHVLRLIPPLTIAAGQLRTLRRALAAALS